MNEEFFKFAMAKIDALTDEEIYEGLKEHGIEAFIRQYPEQEDPQE